MRQVRQSGLTYPHMPTLATRRAIFHERRISSAAFTVGKNTQPIYQIWSLYLYPLRRYERRYKI